MCCRRRPLRADQGQPKPGIRRVTSGDPILLGRPLAAPQGRAGSPGGIVGTDRNGADRKLAIVGLGYVGLPLAIAFVEAGLAVEGIDASEARVAELREGRSPIDDVSDDRLAGALASGLSVSGTGDADVAAAAIVVCVPTPISEAKDPDLEPVLAAAGLIAQRLRRRQLVILQSTTYPGTTRGPFRRELERSGWVAGRDVDLAFAPEPVYPDD